MATKPLTQTTGRRKEAVARARLRPGTGTHTINGKAFDAYFTTAMQRMTVTEALAHGLPVLAAAVGGLPEALGSTADGTRPGQLIPPGDPAALAAALADWLGDEPHRHRLRAAARQRRSTLRGWEQTTQEIANALTGDGRSKPVPPVMNNHPGETSGRA